jgi:excisionase family DNA binding protein
MAEDRVEVLKTDGVAERLGVVPDTVRAYVHQGLIPVTKVSRKTWLFVWPDVVQALRNQQEAE